MAKKKAVAPINLDFGGSDLDDVFNQLDAGKGRGGDDDKAPKDTTTPSDEKPRKSTSAKKTSPRKKKPAASIPSSETSDSVIQAPEGSISREGLIWFFANEADTSKVKQLYVGESTKEVLHQVARTAGIPVGHLADNIMRWFLAAHKNDIKKVISRNRDTLDGLDM